MHCELTCTRTRILIVIEKWKELIVEQRFAILLKIGFVLLDIYVIETKLNFVSFNNKNLQRQQKLLANVTFPYKIHTDQVGSMSKLKH